MLRAVQTEAIEYDISPWQHMLVDPFKRCIERFGRVEDAFVVARGSDRVVYYNDVEDVFGTAKEAGTMLIDCGDYGPLILALREAEAGN